MVVLPPRKAKKPFEPPKEESDALINQQSYRYTNLFLAAKKTLRCFRKSSLIWQFSACFFLATIKGDSRDPQ